MVEEKDDLFVCLIEDIHNNVKEIEIVQASNLSEVKTVLFIIALKLSTE